MAADAADFHPSLHKKMAKVYIFHIFSMTILQRSLANFGEKTGGCSGEVLWCRCGLKRIIFPLIVAAGHKSGDVLGLIGARTLAMLNAILSTYCNSSNKSNTRNTKNTSNASNVSLWMYWGWLGQELWQCSMLTKHRPQRHLARSGDEHSTFSSLISVMCSWMKPTLMFYTWSVQCNGG